MLRAVCVQGLLFSVIKPRIEWESETLAVVCVCVCATAQMRIFKGTRWEEI